MVIYQNVAECLAVINTLKQLGQDIPNWIEEQYNNFIAKEKNGTFYETIKANSKFPYSEELVKCVNDTVENLLTDVPNATEPGLLLGKIQCGKTHAFENIIALSFDKGIDICVVLTKGTNTLAYQTIERFKYDFRHFKETERIDQRNIVEVNDIKELTGRGLTANQINRPGLKRIIVCMKQKDNMQNLINLFQTQELKDKKILIVDDEADFASRNYQVKNAQTNLAKISAQIELFCKHLTYYRYLQVTATPYSLYLQPDGFVQLEHGKATPFKPRFTTILPIHDKYVGGKQYFIDSKNPESMYYHLFHPIKPKCIEVLGKKNEKYIKNNIQSRNLEDLRYALIGYFMATATRTIQERTKGINYRSSAVFHVMTQKHKHQWQKELIERFIKEIHNIFQSGYEKDARIAPLVDIIYENMQKSNLNGLKEGLIEVALPTKNEITKELTNILNDGNYIVHLVNSNNDVKSLLNEDGQLRLDHCANIFIGGNILDRGITISNMLCFFYGRSPNNFQQDTVLQHARMFGARDKKDMAVTQFHTSNLIYNIMARMNELDEQLRQSFINKHDTSVDFVFIGIDKHIKPCSSQKIRISNTMVIKPHLRILPIGFQTGPKSSISQTINHIQTLIESLQEYANRDSDGFFEIDKSVAIEIVHLIRSTYIYEREIDNNSDMIWDENDMIGCIEYSTQNTNGKMYCLHRTNRNMKRIRIDGSFIDAPEDGRTDLQPAKERCTDRPVLMLFRENGLTEQGWRGTPFYWPSLLVQSNINPVIYTVNEKNENRLIEKTDISELIKGIEPESILKLTLSDEIAFNEILDGEQDTYMCTITESNALRHLESDRGELRINHNNTESSKSQYINIYSRNNDIFPYYTKPYKYILFNKSREEDSDVMLVKLDAHHLCECIFKTEPENDILESSRGTTKGIAYKNVGFWTITYNIEQVLGVIKSGQNS